MDTDRVARIINELTEGGRWRMIQATELIDRLADDFQAMSENNCDAKGCDEEGHKHESEGYFQHANFVRIAKATYYVTEAKP